MKYRNALLAACWVGLLAMAFSVALRAQASDQAFIKGTVTESGRPLVSAWVVLSQNGQETRRFLTGDDGKYYIGKISPGGYDISVLEGRVERFKAQVNLPQDSIYNINI
jgi:hypothetical protein